MMKFKRIGARTYGAEFVAPDTDVVDAMALKLA